MMEVEGYIRNFETDQVIPASVQLVNLQTKKSAGKPFFVQYGNYRAWTDQDPAQVALKFTRFGFESKTVSFLQLSENSTVYLKPGGDTILYLMATGVVIAAVAVYRKKSGKVGALGVGDVMPIIMLAGGLIGFTIVKKILEKLGIWDSKDKKGLDDAATNPNSFWNPNFWTTKPSSEQYTFPLTSAQARAYCSSIRDAMGWMDDNEDTVIGIFRSLHSQANASFIAYNFQLMYNEDLLTFLRGGNWPYDRLSDADVFTINNYINNLPKY